MASIIRDLTHLEHGIASNQIWTQPFLEILMKELLHVSTL